MIILIKEIMMNKDDDISWLTKIKYILQIAPKNKEELITLLRDAQVRSLIDSETLEMIEGVIQLANMQVRDIMLPKKQILCIPYDASFEQLINIITTSGHSRFPVTGNNLDEIIGILHAKDLLRYTLNNSQNFDLQDLLRHATFVPESKRLDLLLREFRNHRNHMALVVDEYGNISGFVTLEDIIEQIIGDIEDEFDIDDETYIKKHNDLHYIVKAYTPIEEFNEQLQANLSHMNYDTIAGIVMAEFGCLPKRGEVITIDNFEFKIINADSRRIKLLSCFDKRNMDAK